MTECSGIRTCRITSFITKDTTSDKITPFGDLSIGRIPGRVKRIGIHQGSQWVSTLIGSMWIFFTTGIVGDQVESGLIDETDDLNVTWCTSTDFGKMEKEKRSEKRERVEEES